MSADPVARRHLLVVLPHPDDESFSSGGTIAMHADAGVPVTYLCGTYGDMGRNMGRPFFANRETLRDVREGELREACRILGAKPPPLQTMDEAGLSPMARGFYAENRRVANGKAKRVLGWSPAYPTFREGLAAIRALEQRA